MTLVYLWNAEALTKPLFKVLEKETHGPSERIKHCQMKEKTLSGTGKIIYINLPRVETGNWGNEIK